MMYNVEPMSSLTNMLPQLSTRGPGATFLCNVFKDVQDFEGRGGGRWFLVGIFLARLKLTFCSSISAVQNLFRSFLNSPN